MVCAELPWLQPYFALRRRGSFPGGSTRDYRRLFAPEHPRDQPDNAITITTVMNPKRASLEQHDPGKLAAAAHRDDVGNERQLEPLERVARESGNGRASAITPSGSQSAGIDDVRNPALGGDDKELVVVEEVRRAHPQRVDSKRVEQRAGSSTPFR